MSRASVAACWRASTSVGAISAAWAPASIARSIAAAATTVLPLPTSPCSSRSIGAGLARSPPISAMRALLAGGQREGQGRRASARAACPSPASARPGQARRARRASARGPAGWRRSSSQARLRRAGACGLEIAQRQPADARPAIAAVPARPVLRSQQVGRQPLGQVRRRASMAARSERAAAAVAPGPAPAGRPAACPSAAGAGRAARDGRSASCSPKRPSWPWMRTVAPTGKRLVR